MFIHVTQKMIFNSKIRKTSCKIVLWIACGDLQTARPSAECHTHRLSSKCRRVRVWESILRSCVCPHCSYHGVSTCFQTTQNAIFRLSFGATAMCLRTELSPLLTLESWVGQQVRNISDLSIASDFGLLWNDLNQPFAHFYFDWRKFDRQFFSEVTQSKKSMVRKPRRLES